MLLMRGLGPVDSQGRTLQPSAVFSSAFPSIEIVSSEVDLGTPGTYRLAIRVPAITEGPLTLFVRGPGGDSADDSGLLPVEPDNQLTAHNRQTSRLRQRAGLISG
jgi:hypothetical protein